MTGDPMPMTQTTGRKTRIFNQLTQVPLAKLVKEPLYLKAVYGEVTARLNASLMLESHAERPMPIWTQAESLSEAAGRARFLTVVLKPSEGEETSQLRRELYQLSTLALIGALDLLGRSQSMRYGQSTEPRIGRLTEPLASGPQQAVPPFPWTASPDAVLNLSEFGHDQTLHQGALLPTGNYSMLCLQVQRFESGAQPLPGRSGTNHLDTAINQLVSAPISGDRATMAWADPSLFTLRAGRPSRFAKLLPRPEQTAGENKNAAQELIGSLVALQESLVNVEPSPLGWRSVLRTYVDVEDHPPRPIGARLTIRSPERVLEIETSLSAGRGEKSSAKDLAQERVRKLKALWEGVLPAKEVSVAVLSPGEDLSITDQLVKGDLSEGLKSLEFGDSIKAAFEAAFGGLDLFFSRDSDVDS